MLNVKTIIEPSRRSGLRRPGFFYAIGSRLSPCCFLPIKLAKKFIPQTVFAPKGMVCSVASLFPVEKPECKISTGCAPLSFDFFHILWISAKCYPSPVLYWKEIKFSGSVCHFMGPHFRAENTNRTIGTYAGLAHKNGLLNQPAILWFFRIEEIQYIVRAKDHSENLIWLQQRGVTLVDVIEEGSKRELF